MAGVDELDSEGLELIVAFMDVRIFSGGIAGDGQVADKCFTGVENEADAVVAVAGGMNELAVETERFEEGSAFSCFECDVFFREMNFFPAGFGLDPLF